MRILFWSDSFWPTVGGVQVLGGQLCAALQARGYELVVVTRRDPHAPAGADDYCDIPVHRFPFETALRPHDLDQQFRLRQTLAGLKQSFKPDLVHVFHAGPGIFYHLATAEAHPAPLVVTLHETYADAMLDRQTLGGRLLRTADWVTACSHSVLARTRAQLPEVTRRSSVVPNSLEMPALDPAPLPFQAPQLLCLGRVVRRKGFDLALTAFATVVPEFPRARLIIGGDGPARPDLEEQATTLGLASAVELLGWVPPDHVPAVLNRSTLVIMPSRIEPFGLVALQAAQMARPIVATRVGGLPEIVLDGETGLLVDPEDAKGLGAALRFLLAHPDAAVEMGRAARRRAHQAFGWEKYVDAHDALYRGVLAGNAPATEVSP